MRKSRKRDFRKLKITSVASTYPGRRPQCPSLSPHVLLILFMNKKSVYSVNFTLNYNYYNLKSKNLKFLKICASLKFHASSLAVIKQLIKIL